MGKQLKGSIIHNDTKLWSILFLINQTYYIRLISAAFSHYYNLLINRLTRSKTATDEQSQLKNIQVSQKGDAGLRRDQQEKELGREIERDFSRTATQKHQEWSKGRHRFGSRQRTHHLWGQECWRKTIKVKGSIQKFRRNQFSQLTIHAHEWKGSPFR